jgi:hypothetical protein
MSEPEHVPTARERQALAEVGRPNFGRGVAPFLVAAFLLTVVAGTAVDLAPPSQVPAQRLRDALPEVRQRAAADGWLAGNRALLAAMNDFEDDLERGSRLTATLQPTAQRLLTGSLGAGNEQAYPGADGWLFFRPDVEYVTGPGFLDPATLRRRARGGDAWAPAPHPDPLPAIGALAASLRQRGIALVLVPTPVKPVVHPERLTGRFEAGAGPLHNPSFAELVRRVVAAGVVVVDLAVPLAAAAAEEPQFLRTDTHWTPAAMDLAARQLAGAVRPLLGPAPPGAYRRHPVAVEGLGDIAVMLRLPAGQRLYARERVTAHRVLGPDGRPWAADRGAEVLVLGDSFTNVYSVPGLGWGGGAGLAEQLSFHLERPIDRIAVNDEGAHATRERLALALAGGDDRLAGKRVVIWQLALRELAIGDWRPVPLPAP